MSIAIIVNASDALTDLDFCANFVSGRGRVLGDMDAITSLHYYFRPPLRMALMLDEVLQDISIRSLKQLRPSTFRVCGHALLSLLSRQCELQSLWLNHIVVAGCSWSELISKYHLPSLNRLEILFEGKWDIIYKGITLTSRGPQRVGASSKEAVEQLLGGLSRGSGMLSLDFGAGKWVMERRKMSFEL